MRAKISKAVAVCFFGIVSLQILVGIIALAIGIYLTITQGLAVGEATLIGGILCIVVGFSIMGLYKLCTYLRSDRIRRLKQKDRDDNTEKY